MNNFISLIFKYFVCITVFINIIFSPIALQAIQGGILVSVTIDNGGTLIADGKTFANNGDWTVHETFTLLSNTTGVVIDATNDPDYYGAMLASFSNGVVTDESWECINSSLKSTQTEWPKAVTYGNNDETTFPWGTILKEKIANIKETAQWIWTINRYEKSVTCRKSFGE